jgi:hypothetical protein
MSRTLILLLALALLAGCGKLNYLPAYTAQVDAESTRARLVAAAQETVNRRDNYRYQSSAYGDLLMEATYVPVHADGCSAVPVRQTWAMAGQSGLRVGRYLVHLCPDQPARIETVAEYIERP